MGLLCLPCPCKKVTRVLFETSARATQSEINIFGEGRRQRMTLTCQKTLFLRYHSHNFQTAQKKDGLSAFPSLRSAYQNRRVCQSVNKNVRHEVLNKFSYDLMLEDKE